MKVNVEVECTPEEARTFLGLPDVAPLNDFVIEQMRLKVEQNINSMKPEEMLKTWSSYGVQAQDQFLKLMQSAATASLGSMDAFKK
jgi:hypothetical protein